MFNSDNPAWKDIKKDLRDMRKACGHESIKGQMGVMCLRITNESEERYFRLFKGGKDPDWKEKNMVHEV